jgi:hypothetical protein
MDANRRRPVPPPEAGRPAATDAERERMELAVRAGWTIRFDPVRGEFAAGRDLRTARTLGELLDAVEAADYGV